MAYDNDELTDLIARCAIRDQAALKRLYDTTSAFLNRVAFKIVGSEELSNDVLQEAFIQIWNNAAQYRPDIAKPLTWMTSIVRYRAIDKLGHEKKHRDPVDPGYDLDDLDSENLGTTTAGGSPESCAIMHQERGYLLECLDTLSEQIAESFKLAYLQGFSREDIASQFDTNTNTVKSWLRRGVERLKRCLDSKLAMNA
ncbi:sigma-70 family RNA polymerase sigma factor [Exilibacterium tricleocarpae]|uniref:Sigma-70 family RNA polymerase sigma factor n=1 Tax=Exilibacterium tricleocarpae TaxID=2591008 RepID=A0A545T1U6_9GAMM|nr:sigma-70 family RNA polymerase sigma factor [Exilibacterium tricleocarpae]TQV71176.1 sigma-70 family RNA polymerase sigma factor [Exilibacterium tricleocarpae]